MQGDNQVLNSSDADLENDWQYRGPCELIVVSPGIALTTVRAPSAAACCALGLLPLLAATAASDARRPLRVLAYGSSPLTGLGCDRPDVDACDLGDWTYTVHDGIEQTLGSAAVVDMVSHLHWTARRMCDHFLDRRNAAALFDAGTFVSAESPQLRVGLLLKTRPSTFSWSMDASRSPAPARGDRMAAREWFDVVARELFANGGLGLSLIHI